MEITNKFLLSWALLLFFVFANIPFRAAPKTVSRKPQMPSKPQMRSVAVQRRPKTQLPPKSDFSAKFKVAMAKGKQVLVVMKRALGSLTSEIKRARYDQTSELRLVQVVSQEGQAVGISFDFGYIGAGSLAEGFQGIMVVPVLEVVDPMLQGFFNSIFSKIVGRLIKFGRLDQHPMTGQSVWRSDPIAEFVLKMGLLVHSKRNKLISTPQFAAGLMMLLYKLSLTPGFDSPAKLMQKLPPPFNQLLAGIA